MIASGWPDRVTVWRWHFYAGLLCIPVVLWLAATGSIYLFKPQIDAWLDRPYESLDLTGSAASPTAQVSAALAAVPGSVLNEYQLPRNPHSAVQVLVGRGTQLERVYVHPATLQILQVVDEDRRLTNLIFHLHGELLAGDRGSLVVETAASWTIIMLVTGLYLWWPAGTSGLAGVVYPRLQRNGRLFWRDVHSVTGFWVSFFALFLLISGLPWATSWGGLLKEVRQWSATAPVRQDWTTGRASELDQRRLALQTTDEHAGHHHGKEGVPAGAPDDYRALDGLVPLVRAQSLQPPVLIAPPSHAHPTWTAKSDTQNRPLRAELTLAGANPTVLSRQDFSQLPLLDRIIGIGIAAHEGQLFAPLNQLLGLFTAVSLWLVCISAIVMWWRRRQAGTLGAPARAAGAVGVPLGVLLLIALLGVLLPMFGATLLIVLGVEWALLRRWPTARRYLGLGSPVRGTPILLLLSATTLLPGALLVGCLMPSLARAAPLGSSVRGAVIGPDMRPIAQATVTLKSATSQWTQATRSDRHGSFTFAAVPIGDYSLTVSQAGFATTAQAVTVPSTGSPPLARIELTASITNLPTVTVAADALTAVVKSATPTTLVNRQDIADTPGANRSNSLAMITDFVPGAYFVHDQLHLRGGHQTAWTIDGVEIPNTNIASNLGPQIDPKDIDYLEVQRGGYEADQGDRTYGVFNVIPRTGFERNNGAELLVSAGNYGQTNDYFSLGSHTDDFAYYASVNGNRSDLGIETPVAQIIHDKQDGYGGFSTLVYNATPQDQLRLVLSARRDSYQIPNAPGDTLGDVQREADAFAILSWIRTFNPDLVLTSSVFYHYNRADLDAPADDFPISTTDQRSSTYAGGQETLRIHVSRNDLQVGLLGFAQHDNHLFNVIFNDNSNPPFNQALNPSADLVAAYVEDTFAVTSRWDVIAGVRQTRFSGDITENATSPRIGTTFVIPRLNWILRAFWGKYYQAPPLETVSGPLLSYAQASQLAFLPLRGERDKEREFGLTIPVAGWSIDLSHFITQARSFFDHNSIGNSNVFLPITIDGALIRAWEISIRSPRFWNFGQFHLAYSNQTADGIGGINGGLTDFQPAGYFALDHDQRNTLSVGFEAKLPWQSFAAVNISSGSGFANGDAPPSHLPGHAEADLKIGKSFTPSLSASLSVLNVTNKHLLIDNSLTFGGFHYNNPRQAYAEVDYKFGY